MTTKTCTKCGKTLPVECFDIKDKKRGYRRSWCHECERERSRIYREQNRDKINAQKRQHYQDNKAKIRAAQNEYRKNNKNKISQQRHEHYMKHRDAILAYQAEWRANNQDRIKAYNTRYYAEHGAEICAELRRRRKLNRKYKRLSLDKQQQLFEENKGLVLHIAKRYKCHEDMYYDMIQAGYEGLWKAIVELDKFKPLEAQLSTWLGWYIQRHLSDFTYAAANNSGLSAGASVVKRAMKRNDRDSGILRREEDIRLFTTSSSLDVTITNAKDNSETKLHDIIGAEDEHYDGIAEAVQELLSGLDDIHRDVVVNHFGIGCEPQSLQALARRYAITQERAGQLVKAALEQLRNIPGVTSLAVYL